MRIRPFRLLLTGLVASPLLTGCGAPTSPVEALDRQFGASGIVSIYPFHARLAANDALYFLKLRGDSGPQPEAALMHRYKGNWSVWMYQNFSHITGCAAPVAVVAASMRLSAASTKALIVVGQIQSGSVTRVTFHLAGRSYQANMLPDGFWYVRTPNLGGAVGVSVQDGTGRPVRACFAM